MLKRSFDIAAAGAGLIVLAPVFAVLAIFIKCDSTGPVFFRQTRVGRHGAPFRIHKFRTMRVAAEAVGPQITIGNDVRITRVGSFIRRYKFDELPQLIDVLTGSMSLVGPRPEVPRYVEHYPADIRAQVLSVRPGITDRCSIYFVDESKLLADAADPHAFYVEQLLPVKLDHHLEYVRTRSFAGDLKIIFETLLAIVR